MQLPSGLDNNIEIDGQLCHEWSRSHVKSVSVLPERSAQHSDSILECNVYVVFLYTHTHIPMLG